VKPLFGCYGRIHLVGIAGAGMAPLARLLAGMGCSVSGTDQRGTALIQNLAAEGIRTESPHRAAAVDRADLVVYSAAVPADNEELSRAETLGIPTVKRAEVVGELTRGIYAVGIAGSHGKTTCAAMMTTVLEEAGLEPSSLVGGQRQGRAWGRWGEGRHIVVEADEYDRSFLHLHPRAALVTNVDVDHLECYGDLAGIDAAFIEYLGRVPFYGYKVVCSDDAGGRRLAAAVPGCLTYGLEEGGDFGVVQVVCNDQGSSGIAMGPNGELGPMRLGVLGRHNLSNALGVVAVGYGMGLDFATVAAGLERFRGVERRLDILAEAAGIVVVDDYAHHPAEIRATLAALALGGKRLVAVFQPHLYSRTRDMLDGFAEALSAAQRVVVMPVYGARETPQDGVGSDAIARRMRHNGYAAVDHVDCAEEVVQLLDDEVGSGDTVVFMGAGDIDRYAHSFAAQVGSVGAGQAGGK
jgi:UDP-N-acetylmuramate--alanine ligase